MELEGKCIPRFRFRYSEIYFSILKGIKIRTVVLIETHVSSFFPLFLYACRKLQPGNSQAVITPSLQGFVSCCL